ncbi:MAG: hypothetical protein ACI4PT_11335, partial [Candidatus Avoscillospira sp.]
RATASPQGEALGAPAPVQHIVKSQFLHLPALFTVSPFLFLPPVVYWSAGGFFYGQKAKEQRPGAGFGGGAGDGLL